MSDEVDECTDAAENFASEQRWQEAIYEVCSAVRAIAASQAEQSGAGEAVCGYSGDHGPHAMDILNFCPGLTPTPTPEATDEADVVEQAARRLAARHGFIWTSVTTTTDVDRENWRADARALAAAGLLRDAAPPTAGKVQVDRADLAAVVAGLRSDYGYMYHRLRDELDGFSAALRGDA